MNWFTSWLQYGIFGPPKRKRRAAGSRRPTTSTRERESVMTRRRIERDAERERKQEERQRARQAQKEDRKAARIVAWENRYRRSLEKAGYEPWDADAIIAQADPPKYVLRNPSPATSVYERAMELFEQSRARRNPSLHSGSDPEARAISEAFHGTPDETAVLSDRDRALPREVVVVGEVENIIYKPDRHSQRGGSAWDHEAGDRGLGPFKAKDKPLLVADPSTGRPALVMGKSPMRLNRQLGLVG